MSHSRFRTALAAFIATAFLVGACAPATVAPATAVPPTQPPAATSAPAATTAPTEAAATSAPSGQTVTLNIMHNYGPNDPKGPIIQSVFDEFEKANPDIKIDAQVFADTDIPVKVETAFTAGQEPDIVFNNPAGSKNTWPNEGVSVDVKPLMTAWGFDGRFDPEALKDATDAQGRVVGFPFEGFTWPMWYNTNILKAAGVEIPKTIDDLIAAAPKIRAAGYEPLAAGGADSSGYAIFTIITQLPMTDDQMHVIYGQGTFLTDTVAQQGVDLFAKVRDAGVFAKNSEGLDEQAANQLFFSEKAAMIFEGSWSYSSLPASMADHVALGGMPILATNSPHPSPVMYGGYGKLVWVTRNGAKKMDAVEKFIKFLYSNDQLSKFIQSGGLRSPLVDLQPDPTKLNAFVVQAASLNKITTVIDLTDNDVPQDKFDDLYRASSSAFIPGTTPADIEKTFAAIYAK